jgi:hypothetical protein
VIGLVLANAGLIEDLRASRQRLVTAQDKARRRLERNLHDGAQQDLVALAIKAQLADATIDEDPGPRQTSPRRDQGRRRGRAGEPARPRPRHLPAAAGRPGPGRRAQRPGGQVGAAGDRRGRRCRAVRPRHRGRGVLLLPGSAAEHRQIRPRHPGPYLASGPGRELVLHRVRRRDRLRRPAHPMGSGLRNMAGRLAALGGRLEVQYAPAHGTTITGHLPTVPSPAATIRPSLWQPRCLRPRPALASPPATSREFLLRSA